MSKRWCGVCGYEYTTIRDAARAGKCPKCASRWLSNVRPTLAATNEKRETAARPDAARR